MIEFYGCASRIILSGNSKLRPRAWLTIGRMLKKVGSVELLHKVEVVGMVSQEIVGDCGITNKHALICLSVTAPSTYLVLLYVLSGLPHS